MPLALYDENHKLITDRTPILTEHNGTNGEEVTVLLHLINEDKRYRYDDIVIKATPKEPVDLQLARISQPDQLSSRIDWKRLKPGEVASFKALIRIPAGTKASLIRGTGVAVKWKKYPV